MARKNKIHAISYGYRLACNSKIDDWLLCISSNNLADVTCKKCLARPPHQLLVSMQQATREYYESGAFRT